MADDENPVTKIRERAMELFPDDAEERDDFIEARMKRAGYKRGTGEWLREEDDDSPQDDDDEPITRKDWRAMQREQKAKTSSTATPPKVEKEKVPLKEKGTKNDGNPWWR